MVSLINECRVTHLNHNTTFDAKFKDQYQFYSIFLYKTFFQTFRKFGCNFERCFDRMQINNRIKQSLKQYKKNHPNIYQKCKIINSKKFLMQSSQRLQEHTIHDIKQMVKDEQIQNILIQQISEIFPDMLSVIVIYHKLFIKFKHKPSVNALHVNEFDSSLYMLKINRSFPLENSVRLYLLDGCYQPKIFDTRDLVYQVLGQAWNYTNKLKDIIDKIPIFQQQMADRNENYLALQRTGLFFLGDVFVYNELQEHTSLTLFVDKNSQNNSIINAVSQTHLLTFQKGIKKTKSKQEEEYEMKSKTLYGKKYVLTKFCDLQCIESMQICLQERQITINILKYRSIKSFSDYDGTIRKLAFNDDENLKLFIRIVLKNLPKYQPTKLSFLPAYDKSSPEFKQDTAIQKIIEMNELENRIDPQTINKKNILDESKKQDIVNRLNKSYQKMIEYYSARANPYYLIYVSKLNWLYQKYFVNAVGKSKEVSTSLQQSSKSDKQIESLKSFDLYDKDNQKKLSKSSKIKSTQSFRQLE